MGIVRNPTKPPRLYSKNPRIMERHFNASIFQLFSKRFTYDGEKTLMFDGMPVSTGQVHQLMESFGTLQEFSKTQMNTMEEKHLKIGQRRW